MSAMRNLLLIFLISWLSATSVMAADPLEEYFYASGKIRVVISVVAVVLIGIITYLIWLDRRWRKAGGKK